MREYMKMYMYEQYKGHGMYKYKQKRALTSLLRENSRGTKGVWKDGALKGLQEIHATAALL